MKPTISKLLLSASELVVNLKAGGKDAATHLKAGQIITARVVGDSSSRETVLRILGREVPVKSHTPLKAGETITLRVVSTGNETVLKMMPLPERPAAQPHGLPSLPTRQEPYRFLLEMLNDHGGVKVGTEPAVSQTSRLGRLFTQIALQSDKPDSAFLTRLIQSGGMAWEHKLRQLVLSAHPPGADGVRDMPSGDVKALALEYFREAVSESKESVNPARIFIDQIEEFQLFNKQALEDTGKLLLPFPVAVDGDWRFGQLLIHLNAGREAPRKGGHGPVRIAFLLDLTRLGHLAADFSVYERMVNGFFETADETVRDLIEEGIPELKNRFRLLGFQVTGLDCRLAGTPDAVSTTFLQRVHAEEGLLNVVV
ncbi:MAG: flagellar hook-length control protein FliK [Thermodesulfobacteriota bacterium]